MTRTDPRKIDRDALHRWLWTKRDPSNDRLRIHQAELAEALMVRSDTVFRIVKEFCEQGRMKKIARDPVGLYELIDPVEWDKGITSKPRTIKWG